MIQSIQGTETEQEGASTPLTEESREKHIRREFDLSGEWPLIDGEEWDEWRYVRPRTWEALSEEQREAVRKWMTRHRRVIREVTITEEVKALMHMPRPRPSKLSTTSRDELCLIVNNPWVRHHDCITVTVEGTSIPGEALAYLREWLADMAQVGLADVTGIEDEAA